MNTPDTLVEKERPSIEPLEIRVAPANLVWTGDMDGNWGTNNAGNTNWLGDVLPSDGDALLFPAVPVGNFTNTNNINGLDLISVTIGGTGYIIGTRSKSSCVKVPRDVLIVTRSPSRSV